MSLTHPASVTASSKKDEVTVCQSIDPNNAMIPDLLEEFPSGHMKPAF
jgi:hypothetical protein